MKKLVHFIPNLLTLGNLFCGCLAILIISQQMVLDTDWLHGEENRFTQTTKVTMACWLLIVALLLDFFDGFVARLLQADSPIGKQLDSLADVVSFGVAPGFLMAGLISHSRSHYSLVDQFPEMIYLFGFLIPLAAAYRLATFNVDDDQTTYFKGLATPAATLFFIGLFHFTLFLEEPIHFLRHPMSMMLVCLLISLLMVSKLPLFSLKMKDYSISKHWFRYLFLLICVGLFLAFQLLAFVIIIPLYLLFSIVFRSRFV